MRRNDRAVTNIDEILSIISSCKVIRLAMVDDGRPYIVPLNFGYRYEDGAFTFYCHSAREGRKLDILRQNNTVAFEMDCRGELLEAENACGCSYYYASILGEGHVDFPEGAEKCCALSALMRHMAGREDIFTDEQAQAVTVLAIRVDSLSAKAKKK